MIHDTQHEPQQPIAVPRAQGFLAQLKMYLATMPDVRLAYFMPGPADAALTISGPERARVIISFARSVSKEHIVKRLAKIRRHFMAVTRDEVEYLDIEGMGHREGCEAAFNARVLYGSLELIERDRLYRYHIFLEWNAGRKMAGASQDLPPVLQPSLDRPFGSVSMQAHITPLYRHLKMIEGHLRELRRIAEMPLPEFTADGTQKSLAESYMLKGIQSAILITMSVMHRNMRLAARDYRDLFLRMPYYGMTTRARAEKMVKCAEIRDRLIFQYGEITDVEVHQCVLDVLENLADFKAFILEWIFEHYYGPSGELIQGE